MKPFATILFLSFMSYFGACAQPPQPLSSPTPDSSAFRGNLFKRIQENPLPYDQDISNLPLGQVNGSTVTLVQIRSKFSGSYNAAQDEMLYLVNGRGLMVIGVESKPVGAGDIVVIHKGQNYTIENRSAETLVALAVVSQGGR
jgi:mannose-6-phosphate isomerase-like protein (cupin superfamily)